MTVIGRTKLIDTQQQKYSTGYNFRCKNVASGNNCFSSCLRTISSIKQSTSLNNNFVTCHFVDSISFTKSCFTC